MTAPVSSSTIVSVPAATPTRADAPPAGKSGGAPEVSASAFAAYTSRAGAATAGQADPGTAQAPRRNAHGAGVNDPIGAVQRVAEDWKKAGVDPDRIRAIEEPLMWRHAFDSDLPAIEQLAGELKATGQLDAFRTQAIRIIRGTPAWQQLLDRRQGQQPGVARDLLEHRLVADIFGWKNADRQHNARVMYLVVNAATVARYVKGGVHAWDALMSGETGPRTVPNPFPYVNTARCA
ncbi:hypothetical protein CAL14_18685 [Bordetella genomosp. 9]|uniref:hypothetical protein n=1 Tax=Bordetella genomosp. 9 TaxID=1416803 RepID=UPI000A2969E8|nr:hypothetical protein [Bordetella genomosp. 9]ARP92060.1 hypothetical protein CAL14_18685 [Bordetella genomosp. 9]